MRKGGKSFSSTSIYGQTSASVLLSDITAKPTSKYKITAEVVCVGYGVGVCVAFGCVHTYVGVFTNVIYSVRFGLSPPVQVDSFLGHYNQSF